VFLEKELNNSKIILESDIKKLEELQEKSEAPASELIQIYENKVSADKKYIQSLNSQNDVLSKVESAKELHSQGALREAKSKLA